ncbi:hypothetical protein J8F10_34080 [Gemmata sp. G18]|uniref:Uncharacterized protein n=1 Tax=Gemmata palustris TaxID=2822762 RepID=A0ABS5C2T3_9BACT|nr:hypothetical protein [Gemmata palustris]MBP3960284.1 hypothetical protein [Gemmata palustris]
MNRLLTFAAFAALVVSSFPSTPGCAEEPKPTPTVDLSSSVADIDQLKVIPGTSVILSQKEWERLAAAWGIKDPPKVDFTKELLLVGTWRGSSFKFLSDVKDGDLTTELVGDKEMNPGFRFKVVSLNRNGIKSFQGKALPSE